MGVGVDGRFACSMSIALSVTSSRQHSHVLHIYPRHCSDLHNLFHYPVPLVLMPVGKCSGAANEGSGGLYANAPEWHEGALLSRCPLYRAKSCSCRSVSTSYRATLLKSVLSSKNTE